MQPTLEQAARELATAHRAVVGDDLKVYEIADDGTDEIRLVEVSDAFLPTGEVWPITFGADRQIPYRTTVVQLTRAEWAQVIAGEPTMRLPTGWQVERHRELNGDRS
ncbi:MAG: hypothetical protein IT204_17080 [Fimbriimonadaceae bacterium]|nr:hypothetical protein [Fimbriimonadaceae bacterium]